MAHQRFADTGTVDHVEHACGHAGGHHCPLDGLGHPFGSGHVAAVRLHHHRATGGQRRGGIPPCGGEGQREVAGAEHGYRADAGTVLAQVRARQRLTLGLGTVDARPQVVATAQHLGEQAHLVAGARAFALDAPGRQCGFAAHGGDKTVVQRIQLVGNGIEELRTALRRQDVVFGEGRFGSLGGGVHFLRGGLGKGLRKGFAGARVEALQAHAAGSAALAANEVASGHGWLL